MAVPFESAVNGLGRLRLRPEAHGAIEKRPSDLTNRGRVRLERFMARAPKEMANWGDLNIALNVLVKEGLILSYKTGRAGKGAETAIEVTTAPGADQAEVVRRVREVLTGAYADATVRTRTA